MSGKLAPRDPLLDDPLRIDILHRTMFHSDPGLTDGNSLLKIGFGLAPGAIDRHSIAEHDVLRPSSTPLPVSKSDMNLMNLTGTRHGTPRSSVIRRPKSRDPSHRRLDRLRAVPAVDHVNGDGLRRRRSYPRDSEQEGEGATTVRSRR